MSHLYNTRSVKGDSPIFADTKIGTVPNAQATPRSSRRDFLKTSSALAAAGALAGSLSIGRSAHAAGSDLLKIGLVGCGGRGTGAAVNALGADKNCKLVAMADVFSDRLQSSLESIKKEFPDKVAVAAGSLLRGIRRRQEADRRATSTW